MVFVYSPCTFMSDNICFCAAILALSYILNYRHFGEAMACLVLAK